MNTLDLNLELNKLPNIIFFMKMSLFHVFQTSYQTMILFLPGILSIPKP